MRMRGDTWRVPRVGFDLIQCLADGERFELDRCLEFDRRF